MIKKIIQYGFNKFGYQVHKIPHHQNDAVLSEFSMERALQRCHDRGLTVNTVIDVGASDGRWSRICMKILPNAKYLLIEANNAHKNGLDDFINEFKNAEYILAAASNKEGKVYFDNSDIFGGLASETPLEYNCIEVQSCTIDIEIKKRSLKPPYLIKLDTHGYEKQIILGALNSIKSAELIVIETYNYKLTQESLKYFQLCEYMEKLGFSSIEMVDFMLREYDNSFWQMDTFFIPSIRKEFSHKSYL